eukprot:11312-Heterococcus_DN1.PRE.1
MSATSEQATVVINTERRGSNGLGLAVDGAAVQGAAVVGLAVVGTAVHGAAVVGLAVAVRDSIRTRSVVTQGSVTHQTKLARVNRYCSLKSTDQTPVNAHLTLKTTLLSTRSAYKAYSLSKQLTSNALVNNHVTQALYGVQYLLGAAVVGLAVHGAAVVGAAVHGAAVVGAAVVGLAVVGAAVVGVAVVGDAVGFPARGSKRTHRHARVLIS